jgi:3',5'-cyclic AMP phosphodiesterase CpdA
MLAADPLADHKDRGISAAAANVVSSSRMADVVRRISLVRQKEPELTAILLCGDLTTKGCLDGYKSCLNFLRQSLLLSDQEYWQSRRLVSVPGNHDLNRSAITPGQPPEEKFVPIAQAWLSLIGSDAHLNIGPPVAIDVPASATSVVDPSIRIMALNTCFLCGEHRAFPEKLRLKLEEALALLKEEISTGDYNALMSEQIDCPAVERTHIEAVCNLIQESADESVAVVLGHHPLFAQPSPRIDGYAELLNAGFVREALLSTRRNVLYLHGHIHQEPILVVNSPVRGGNRIIHVSAPALSDGFNLIRIFFSEKTSQPLGLELVPYRFGEHLGMEERDPIALRLIGSEALWNELDDPWLTFVLSKLSSPGHVLRFSELLRQVPSSLRGDDGDAELQTCLRNALRILELLELIIINNRDKSEKLWQCRRTTV